MRVTARLTSFVLGPQISIDGKSIQAVDYFKSVTARIALPSTTVLQASAIG